MKKRIYILVMAIVLVACKKDLADLNTDPNNDTTTSPELLLKYSVKQGMGGYLIASHLEYNALQQWMMYMATRSGVQQGQAYVSPAGADGFWQQSYANAMNNAQAVLRLTEDQADNVNVRAAATIWKVYLMHRVTDLWGAAPYSQALQGNPQLEFTPAYDSQKEIYSQMLSQLEEAVRSIQPNAPFVSADADLLYAGDIKLWRRFANSLRFRLAMHLSEVAPEQAYAILQSLQSEPMIESEEHTAAFQFNSVFNKPLYEAAVIRYQEGAAYINPSKFLVDHLLSTDDPRTSFLLQKTSLSATFPFIAEYRGVPNLLPYNSPVWEQYNIDAQLGDPNGQWGDVSRVGEWYLNNSRPMPLLSYAEVCFLKTEAAFRGWWMGSAEDYFEEGVQAHMRYMNTYSSHYKISDMQILNYLNQFDQIDLETIIYQKYILFAYENVMEAYVDYRRTGYPVLTNYEGETVSDDNFPKRLRYPYAEYVLNRDSYLQAVQQQGPDTQQTLLWWDK